MTPTPLLRAASSHARGDVPRTYWVTDSQAALLRDAIDILLRVLPDVTQPPSRPAPRSCPVAEFAKSFLTADVADDMSTEELWRFYQEIAAVGDLEQISRRTFERALPSAIAAAFGVKKCHSIQRDGRAVRGFRGVTVRA